MQPKFGGGYDKGREHHNQNEPYSDTDKCWRFYQDDQWYGLERDNEIPAFQELHQADCSL